MSYAVRQMVEYRSKQWGIYREGLDGLELVEGGFFDRNEAEQAMWADYGAPIEREEEAA